MSEFGLITCLGKASWGVWSCRLAARLGGVVLCYIVNQVLVRLWARAIGISLSVSNRLGWSRSRRSADLSDRELLFFRANANHSCDESGAPTVDGEGSEAL
jgi:hypothetical protein